MFHDFSKPLNTFIRDMVYGIQATGDTILTDISRAVDSEQKHRNVENRLSRNLQTEDLAKKLQDIVISDAKRFIEGERHNDACLSRLHGDRMQVRFAKDRPSRKAIVKYDSHGKETHCKIDFVVMPVKLPWRDEELRLVVVKGFGKKPMMLLTNLAVNEKLQAEGKDGTDHSYQALWQVVEGYLTRWRIEETIRFVKQCYGFENMHQRFKEVPEFFLYALADGTRRAFSRYGKWETKAIVRKKDNQPDLPGWDDVPYLGVG